MESETAGALVYCVTMFALCFLYWCFTRPKYKAATARLKGHVHVVRKKGSGDTRYQAVAELPRRVRLVTDAETTHKTAKLKAEQAAARLGATIEWK